MKKMIFIIFIFSSQILYANTTSILFLGDSLTEGLGVAKKSAYPFLVQELIKTKLKKEVKAINAGVSGSTTSDGLARLKWYLRTKPNIVFIALGANDGLRGLDLKESQKNLEQIINQALKSGSKVLLAGMLIPPNYGPNYTNDFRNMFIKLKDKYKLKFMPFLLNKVAGEQTLNQADGIHPNEKGHKIIANEVFEFLKEEI
ncbi:arylesterase [Halarcobacter mediterraneus]|uniref:Arylesterase n=1 Tax=Halarcobacter mediterraneus TaxID=2023153 RepID=A0A4V1M161_9BACT|nr:arylesterase [Halarcobacter mediterraneus]RXK12326.1 arylesterase [Halarcobacter mediterraneus]